MAGLLDLDEFQCFKVFFHIVKFSNGSGNEGTEAYTNTLTCQINLYYSSKNIYFVNTGYDEILSDNFANYNASDEDALFNTNKKDSVINVYLIPKDEANNLYGGVADDIPGTALIMTNSNFRLTSTIFPHEVGHVLGLYHTHHGVSGGLCRNLK